MLRELRVTATAVLPDGMFEEAAALVALQPIVETFRACLEALSDKNVTEEIHFDMLIVRPRGEKEPADGPA